MRWYNYWTLTEWSCKNLFTIGLIASRLIVEFITLTSALTGISVDLTLACSFKAYCSFATVCIGTSFVMDTLKTPMQQDPSQDSSSPRSSDWINASGGLALNCFPRTYGYSRHLYNYHSWEGLIGMLSRIARQTLRHSVSENKLASRIQFLPYTRIQPNSLPQYLHEQWVLLPLCIL